MAKKVRKENVHFDSLKKNGFPDMSQIFERIHLSERAIGMFYRCRINLDQNGQEVIATHFG